MTFDRGELIWLNFSPQKGHEQAGRRPAVVISPAAYNQLSNCILLCPITFNMSPWPWKVILPEGLPVSGAVLVDQLKSIDVTARQAEATGTSLPEQLMQDILSRLRTLI